MVYEFDMNRRIRTKNMLMSQPYALASAVDRKRNIRQINQKRNVRRKLKSYIIYIAILE